MIHCQYFLPGLWFIFTSFFTDPDITDDVALMTEMLKVLILGLKVMNEESSQLDLEIIWSKTKIQASESIHGSSVPVRGHQVNLLTHLSTWVHPLTKTAGATSTSIEKSSSPAPA